MSIKSLNRSTVASSTRVAGCMAQRFNDSTILVFNRRQTRKINLQRMRQITQALVQELKLNRAVIGVNLVGTKEITLLNEKFLRHAGSTDVITFDYAPGVPPSGGCISGASHLAGRLGPGSRALHGEVFICVDEALAQARRFGTRWQSEIIRYLIHGMLHLLGFDDAHAAARRRMKRAEDRLLRRLARRFSLAQLSAPAKIPA